MHFLRLTAALAAAAPFSLASPHARSEQDSTADAQRVNTFSLSQQAVHLQAERGMKKFGPVAYNHALAKYNALIPTHVVAAAAAASSSASVSANPIYVDEEYLCPVLVGTPGKTLFLDFDTGSADLWVFSDKEPAAQSRGHLIYNPGSSKTSSLKQGYTWNIGYGDGSGAKGIVYGDKVVVGGVTATSQAVEAATSVSSAFVQDTASDGLLGLSFSTINTVRPKQQTTFFDTVRSTLVKPVFCSYLRHAAPGSYDFGFIDTKKYTGNLSYAPISTARGYWEFNAGNFIVGSNASSGVLGDTIADTGTSLILVPYSVASKYYAKVPGATYSNAYGGFIFPCNTKLQTFSITVGGQLKTVPAPYMSYAPIGRGQCYGGIQSNEGLPFSILGDVFLKSQYAVFDAGNTRIGFAHHK